MGLHPMICVANLAFYMLLLIFVAGGTAVFMYLHVVYDYFHVQ